MFLKLTTAKFILLSIQLNNLGKKFNREWIFKNLSYVIHPNQKLLISGGNGSGKSTLLQVISGFITANEGTIIYRVDGKEIPAEDIKDYISFASPYLQLTEDFTLLELIDHIKIYKPFFGNKSTNEVMELLDLTQAKSKYIKQFSSGMKQRLKLGLAILADTKLLLLDEPVSNLDRKAIDWYKTILRDHSNNRCIIVCSNAISDEHFLCDSELIVSDFKPGAILKNL